MWVHGANLYKVYNYHDCRAHGYEGSGILPRLDCFGMKWFGMIFGVAYVEPCHP
jgi:hypothetical protein